MDDIESIIDKAFEEVNKENVTQIAMNDLSKIDEIIVVVTKKVVNKTLNFRLISEMEDIIQEVRLTVFLDKFNTYRPDDSSFYTFCTWRIKGALSNYLRMMMSDKRKINYDTATISFQDVVKEVSDDDSEICIEDVVGIEFTEFEKIEVMEFIMTLTDNERKVLDCLLDIGIKAEDKRVKAISKKLKLSVDEVMTNIENLRAKITIYNT